MRWWNHMPLGIEIECIEDVWVTDKYDPKGPKPPRKGDRFTVTAFVTVPKHLLAEYPCGMLLALLGDSTYLYEAEGFRPVAPQRAASETRVPEEA